MLEKLGLKHPTGPLPPKYQPKVTVRISCGRSKQVVEFSVDIPIEGASQKSFFDCEHKLRDIFEKLGILAGETKLEVRDAVGSLQEKEEKSEADDQSRSKEKKAWPAKEDLCKTWPPSREEDKPD